MAVRLTASRLDLLVAYGRMLTIRRFEETRRSSSGSRTRSPGRSISAVGRRRSPSARWRPSSRTTGSSRPTAATAGRSRAGFRSPSCSPRSARRAAGTNGGRGGSAYLSAPEHRFLGENSIVGAGLPIANGVGAGAARCPDRDGVAVVSFGDGATSQGATHEALVIAVARKLPVIFVCENNDWSEMTPIAAIAPLEDLADRAAAYGMPGATSTATIPEAVADGDRRPPPSGPERRRADVRRVQDGPL